jgi:hypothetical protein
VGDPEGVTSDSVKVLFIAGAGRSGSTLLASVLGQVPGLFSAGEVRFLWERGLVENGKCGCGAGVVHCPTWQRILAAAFGEPDAPAQQDLRARLLEMATAASEADHRLTRVRHLPRLLVARRRPQRLVRRLGPYPTLLSRLYGAIPSATGCDVVVDSSKLPGHAALLGALPGVELFVVHLVRDPRGVAYSWQKRRDNPDRPIGGAMARAVPLKSALLWNLWNAIPELLWGREPGRYLRVRYEDFVAEPKAVCAEVLRMLGRDDDPDAIVVKGRTLKLAATHSVAGNPNRLLHGSLDLRSDREWARKLSLGHAALVTVVTAPLLHRYHYPRTRTGVSGVRLADLPPMAYALGRFRANVAWIKDRGWAPFIEEHDLDPRTRLPRARARRRWRRSQGAAPGEAVPVLIVGLQRSGTNMVVRMLGRLPQVEVRSENDRRTFRRYQLRPVAEVRQVIAASRSRYVVLKPLCDSHRTHELLAELPVSRPGRAIWVYRHYEGRARSSVAKFGDSNLAVLHELGADGPPRWQLQRLSPESMELLADLDLASMSPASGAALWWYVRNQLYFELGLHQRDDVTLISYDALVADPGATVGRLCAFLELAYQPALLEGLARRPVPGQGPLQLDPLVRRHCDELQARLDDAAREKAARLRG